MLWLVFALLTAATLAALLWPLVKAPVVSGFRTDYDLAVYRAQLVEVAADADNGVLPPDQADAARIEIQRRMLTAAPSPAATDDPAARKAAAFAIALVLPVAAGLLYASLGNPRLPGAPYAERLDHDPAVILADAAAKLETALAARPRVEGYRRLSEFYLRTGDVGRAQGAIKNAMQLGGDSAADWADLGEIEVVAAQGAVVPEALAAFAKALSRDAREPRARFYVGLAEAEIGNRTHAVAIWRDLETDSKPGAPWLPILRRQIEVMSNAGKFDPASVPPAPPSPEALTAALKAMAGRMRPQP